MSWTGEEDKNMTLRLPMQTAVATGLAALWYQTMNYWLPKPRPTGVAVCSGDPSSPGFGRSISFRDSGLSRSYIIRRRLTLGSTVPLDGEAASPHS